MNDAPLAAALELADYGIRTFPVDPATKRPRCKAWPETATLDPASIWIPGSVVGMPCGAENDRLVVDIDLRDGGEIWLADNEHRLPATERYHTRSGGQHIVFRHVHGIKNSVGKIASGVDIRADGGYVARWAIDVQHEHEIADAPGWLVEQLQAVQRSETPKPPSADLAAPDADTLIGLLQAMPNPSDFNRSDWISVSLAVHGASDSIPDLEPEKYSEIVDAWLGWCFRYPDGQEDDCESRWNNDISQRDVRTGWRHLLGWAARAGLDTAPWRPDGSEFPPLPDEPDTSPAPQAQFYRDEQDPFGGRNWLVYEMLSERGVAFLAGQSRAGKTFCALDLALSVCTGEPFAGRDVDRTGGVLYLAAEGASEIPLRWRAAKAARGHTGRDLPFLWRDRMPCTLLEAQAAERFTATAKQAQAELARDSIPLALIVVDTLAAAAGFQDENAAGEAQRAMNVLQHLARETGALVVVIDHYGKTAEAGIRGSSAKQANADNVIAVHVDISEDGGTISNRRLSIQKCRGAKEGGTIPFGLREHVMGADRKGRRIETCSVDWTVQPKAKEARLGNAALAARGVLEKLIREADGGEVTEDEWREVCINGREVSQSDDRDNRKRTFNRASVKLINARVVLSTGGIVRLATGGDEFADLHSLAETTPDGAGTPGQAGTCPDVPAQTIPAWRLETGTDKTAPLEGRCPVPVQRSPGHVSVARLATTPSGKRARVRLVEIAQPHWSAADLALLQ